MKKIKYVIGIIITIIIILIAVIIVKSKNKKEEIANQENEIGTEMSKDLDEDLKNTIGAESKDVEGNEEFFWVMSCANQYFNAIDKTTWSTQDSQEIDEEQRKAYLQNIYNLLDESYIKENSIDLTDVLNYVEDVDEKIFYIPLKMKVYTTEDGQTSKYAIYGIKEKMDYEYISDFYIVVLANRFDGGSVFSVIPQINKNYKSIDDIDLKTDNVEIKENDSNQNNNNNFDNEYITRQYVDYYKKLSLGKPEVAYNLLDKEYRDKRFGSLENYKNYIEENKEESNTAYLKQYLVNNRKDDVQYVGRDQYGRPYVFNVKTPNDYTIWLDTYTIPTEYFKEQYNTDNAEKKVQLNVNKFIMMINTQDWNAAYGVLDEGFKNNYFKTIDDFKNYVKRNAYKYNDIKINSFETTGDVYKCGVSLTDMSNGTYKDSSKGSGGSGYVYNWNLNMKLGDGMDFIISFEVEQ